MNILDFFRAKTDEEIRKAQESAKAVSAFLKQRVKDFENFSNTETAKKIREYPAPQWLQKASQGMKSFSESQPADFNNQTNNPFKPSIGNIIGGPAYTAWKMANTKFNFGETNKTSAGKVAGGFADAMLNIPNRLLTVTKEGYGKDNLDTAQSRQAMLQRSGRAFEVGTDIGSMMVGPSTAWKAGVEGFAKPALKTAMYYGGKEMGKLGVKMAPSYILSKMLQAEPGKRVEAGINELPKQAFNVLAMTGLGVASPVAGRGVSIAWDEAKNILGDLKNPAVTKSIRFYVDKKWMTIPEIEEHITNKNAEVGNNPMFGEEITAEAQRLASKSKAAIFEKSNPKLFKSWMLQKFSNQGGLNMENVAGTKTPLQEGGKMNEVRQANIDGLTRRFDSMVDQGRTVASSSEGAAQQKIRQAQLSQTTPSQEFYDQSYSDVTQALKNTWRLRAREYFVDRMARVKNLLSTKNIKISDEADPYLAETLFHGRVATRLEEAKNQIAQLDKDIINTSKKFKSFNVDDSTFLQKDKKYLIATHTPERNAA
jgi:hypothetical protein